MNTFDHKVVEGFIQTMERNGVGLATQSNAFDKLTSVLLDAHRLGPFAESPLTGDERLWSAQWRGGCGQSPQHRG
ncbi:hypothetical protein ACWD25_17330 [Streptomyces sp. NPDC002920]